MANYDITLIAVEVRKWDIEAQRITMASFYVLEKEERTLQFDVTIVQPPEMVEEFLGKLRVNCESKLKEEQKNGDITVGFDNETFLRQKLYNYFKRITMELNNPRRRKGQPKMIFTTHMDVYNENQDISFLPQHIQFFVALNWARKYYEREDYARAVEPLKKLVAIQPDYGPGYKWLARSLKKIRKYEESMHYYEKYAEVEGTTEAWLELAKSYRKGKVFDKSEAIYRSILEQDPQNKEARIGLAQIKFARKEADFLDILDQLYEEDPDWVKDWLVEEFNFRIYVSEKTLLSPYQAARFLGYDKTYELTQRAFQNEVPSHFNPGSAKLTFYKEELEEWAKIMNRYQCLGEEIKLYPERIADLQPIKVDEEELLPVTESSQKRRKNQRTSTRVEEILKKLRAKKEAPVESSPPPPAQEAAGETPSEDKTETAVREASGAENPPADTQSGRKKRGRPRKTSTATSSTPESSSTAPEDEESAAKKRGKTSKKKAAKQEEEQSSVEESGEKSKKSSRKKDENNEEEIDASEVKEIEAVSNLKSNEPAA